MLIIQGDATFIRSPEEGWKEPALTNAAFWVNGGISVPQHLIAHQDSGTMQQKAFCLENAGH